MQIQNGASGFDGWSKMMIFVVVVDYDGDNKLQMPIIGGMP